MNASSLTLADAVPAHFAAIAAIERATSNGSVVALTEGQALGEARQRGHYLTVALADGDVGGWIWFHADLGRGGEEVGQVFRLCVANQHRRTGVGRTLLEHARETLTQRGCTTLRATVDGTDDAARAFLERMGFGVDAFVMERAL